MTAPSLDISLQIEIDNSGSSWVSNSRTDQGTIHFKKGLERVTNAFINELKRLRRVLTDALDKESPLEQSSWPFQLIEWFDHASTALKNSKKWSNAANADPFAVVHTSIMLEEFRINTTGTQLSQNLTEKLVRLLSAELVQSNTNVKQIDQALNATASKSTNQIGRLANRPDLSNNELSQKIEPLAMDYLYASAFSTRLDRIRRPFFFNLLLTLAGEQSRVKATVPAPAPATFKRPSTSTTRTSQNTGGAYKKRRFN